MRERKHEGDKGERARKREIQGGRETERQRESLGERMRMKEGERGEKRG